MIHIIYKTYNTYIRIYIYICIYINPQEYGSSYFFMPKQRDPSLVKFIFGEFSLRPKNPAKAKESGGSEPPKKPQKKPQIGWLKTRNIWVFPKIMVPQNGW